MARLTFSKTAAFGVSALVAVAALGLTANSAGAVSAKVRQACAADYKAYCPAYEPNSSAARQCMRHVGKGLSDRCIQALKDAGEIPRSARK